MALGLPAFDNVRKATLCLNILFVFLIVTIFFLYEGQISNEYLVLVQFKFCYLKILLFRVCVRFYHIHIWRQNYPLHSVK